MYFIVSIMYFIVSIVLESHENLHHYKYQMLH